jgi:hypothetical protein
MPRSGHRKVTREELIRELAWLAKRRGEKVTQRDLMNHLSCSHDAIHRHFATWKELRHAAGLKTPRAPGRPAFSDADLCDEYNRLRGLLGREPTVVEFNKLARCCYSTLKRRFGDDAEIWRRTKSREAFVQVHGYNLPPQRPSRSAMNRLSEAWQSLKIGFALHSSDLKGIPAEQFDVVLCLRADWPGCPWATVELRDLKNLKAV